MRSTVPVDAVEWLASGESDLDGLFAARFAVSETRALAFLEMVEQALALLRNFPELAPVYRHPFRRFILRDMQTGIFYTLEGRRLFIHALLDLRQDPATLRRRLGLS